MCFVHHSREIVPGCPMCEGVCVCLYGVFYGCMEICNLLFGGASVGSKHFVRLCRLWLP